MTGFETATLGFYTMQSMIGLAQCGLIWMGLKQMSRLLGIEGKRGNKTA